MSEVADAHDGVEYVDLENMTESEIMEERRELQDTVISIQSQLADDEIFPRRDPMWRIRARAKLGHTIADRDMLNDELRRRFKRDNPQATPRDIAAAVLELQTQKVAEAQALAEAKRMRAQEAQALVERARLKTERVRMVEGQRKNREVRFYEAAKTILSPKQIMEIWAKAQALFPEDPCWLPAPGEPDDATKQAIVSAHAAGEGGYHTLADRFGVPYGTVRKLVRKAKDGGRP